MLDLQKNFYELWTRINAKSYAKPTFDHLKSKYSEEGRFYHTFDHVSHCLELFYKHRTFADQPYAIELALFFHDIIYDTKSENNEVNSALEARKACVDAKLDYKFTISVYDLILATRHGLVGFKKDTQLLTDCDLSILGSDPEVYDDYSKKIRKEYAHVPTKRFNKERKKILQKINKGRIFHTPAGIHLEAQAKENLEREIARL